MFVNLFLALGLKVFFLAMDTGQARLALPKTTTNIIKKTNKSTKKL